MSRKVLDTKEVVKYTKYKGIVLPEGFPMKKYGDRMMPDAKKATDEQILELSKLVGGSNNMADYSKAVWREAKKRGISLSSVEDWANMTNEVLIQKAKEIYNRGEDYRYFEDKARERGILDKLAKELGGNTYKGVSLPDSFPMKKYGKRIILDARKATDKQIEELILKLKIQGNSVESAEKYSQVLMREARKRGISTNFREGNIPTLEEIKKEALKYKTKADFHRNGTFYSRAGMKLKEWDKITEHMTYGGFGYNKKETAYFYKQKIQHDNKTYLGYGISNYPKQRLSQHRTTLSKIQATNDVTKMWSGSGADIAKFESDLKKVINNQREMALLIEGFKTESASWDTYEAIVDLLAQKYNLELVNPSEFGATYGEGASSNI